MLKRLILPLGVTTLAFGLSGGLLAGCSVLIDVDGKQCSTNQDCEALGAAFSGAVCEQNVCVAKSVANGGTNGTGGTDGAGGESDTPPDPLKCEPKEKATTPTVKYTFAPIVAGLPATAEPKPFRIKVCGAFDLECATPLFDLSDAPPGEPAVLDVPIGTTGFSGYFLITNPDTVDGLLFMGRPVVEDTVGWNVTMPTPGLVQGFGVITGESVDPTKGLIISVARDCDAVPLEGVKFTNSKAGLQFYFVNNTPDTSLEETGPQGAVGFANVEISTTTLKATTGAGQDLVPAIIRVKPNTVSLVELFP